MKKTVLAVVSALLLAAFALPSTYAYFTKSAYAENVITSGDIKIALCEENGEDISQEIYPNKTVEKKVYVTNTGDHPAYVRVKAEINSELETDQSLIVPKLDLISWADGKDGWYYYKKALLPGEDTSPLFSEIYFSSELSEEFGGAVLTLKVAAQGVQSENNADDPREAYGWPQ